MRNADQTPISRSRSQYMKLELIMYFLIGHGEFWAPSQHPHSHLTRLIEMEMRSTWCVTADALITGNYCCLINYGNAICSHTCYRLTRYDNWGTLLGSSQRNVVRIGYDGNIASILISDLRNRVAVILRVLTMERVSAAAISSGAWKCNSKSWTECNRTTSNCNIRIYFYYFLRCIPVYSYMLLLLR